MMLLTRALFHSIAGRASNTTSSKKSASRLKALLFLRQGWLAGLIGTLVSSSAWADWTVNMTEGVTAVSRSVYSLHMIIFIICVVIGVLVFGVMFYSILVHRKSKGAVPQQFHESTLVEVLWTTVPFLILVGMAIPATKTLVDIYNTDESEVDIKITGYQWKWQYEYVGEGVSFFSNLSTPREQIQNTRIKNPNYLLEVDEPLVLPVGKKVRFLVTAADVIHSWWVPAFAVKRDAIPGFINEAWTKVEEPGIYRGQCAELCGKDHGFMPIVVDVRSDEDYAKWLAERKEKAAKERMILEEDWPMDRLMTTGKKVYEKTCAVCHQVNGQGMPPVFPALKGADLVVDKARVGEHVDILMNGIKGTAMQSFANQLNEAEIAAVITYERNAWGNNTGEMVTPKEILNYKKSGKYTPDPDNKTVTPFVDTKQAGL